MKSYNINLAEIYALLNEGEKLIPITKEALESVRDFADYIALNNQRLRDGKIDEFVEDTMMPYNHEVNSLLK